MSTRSERLEAVGIRYRASERRQRSTILDEFVAVTRYHRKHAIRLLARKGVREKGGGSRRSQRRSRLLRVRCAGSGDPALGGVGPGLRQAAAANDPSVAAAPGTAWPGRVGSGDARAGVGRERGHNRPAAVGPASAGGIGTAPPGWLWLVRLPQRAGMDVRPLGDPRPRWVEADFVADGGTTVSERVCPDDGADGHGHGVDGVHRAGAARSGVGSCRAGARLRCSRSRGSGGGWAFRQ